MLKSSLLLYIVLILYFANPLLAQWEVLPDRMWADSIHTSFQYGVASGDPLPDAVIIWTRINGDAQNELLVNWKVATDNAMINVVQTGTVSSSAETDWTVKTDVIGLSAYTTYYYQFSDESGNQSAIGRTRTAPDNNIPTGNLKFAIASCSSIYSGYFNAYARIAERNDIDLVIHLGDYIYDYVDEDEQIRVPEPAPVDPQTKAEFRQRHRYYLLDPDLRAVRQQHPLFVMWDNHDIYKNNETDLIGSIEAFFEYLPIRQPDLTDPKRIYRTLHYGELADIILMDIELLRNQDTIAGTDENSLLSAAQYEWLINELENSTATWRVIGNQKLFSNWAIDHVEGDLPFGNGIVADPGAWDGFPAERARLLDFLRDKDINNNIIISGDIHLSVAADLVINPKDSLEYNPETGEGAIGVEFVPASVTRGNVDETLHIPPTPGSLDALVDLSFEGNPHHEYMELLQHGYGLLDIVPDSTVAQFVYSEKHEFLTTDTIWKELVVRIDENHWANTMPAVGVGEPVQQTEQFEMTALRPNPVSGKCSFSLSVREPQKVNLEIIDLQGRLHETGFNNPELLSSMTTRQFELNTDNLPCGTYFIRITGEQFSAYQRLVRMAN